MRAMRNKKVGKAEQLMKALERLKYHNLVSEPVKLPTRKPTTLYYVHPTALAQDENNN
jgi:hypothetical protein